MSSPNNYVGPPYCRVELYAGRVACCPLVSHGEYTEGTDRQTDGRQTVTFRFPLNAASVINQKCIA